MIPKPLHQIQAADIEALVTNGEMESRTLDFKRDIPGGADQHKIELCADVTSFANTSGGDIIFGVDEEDGKANAVRGITGSGVDAETQRLTQVIQSGTDPRVPGIDPRAIEVPGKGHVIVLRVPQSWCGPHLVKHNGSFRMYGRKGPSKYILDATEIRSSFAMSEQLPEKIRRWRDERLARVIGGETPVPLEDGPRMIVHLVPLASFGGGVSFSGEQLLAQAKNTFPGMGGAFNSRVNIDGILTYKRESEHRHSAYCQVFRSGRVERVSAESTALSHKGQSLRGEWLEDSILEFFAASLGGLKALDIPLPLVVMVTVAGVRGVWFQINDQFMGENDRTFDRDILLLPDVELQSYSADMFTILRPVFDTLWNAGGAPRSRSYGDDGKWKRKLPPLRL